MARLNKTRYALLGFLSMGPASGYDIKIRMEQSTEHFWKEGDASIYPILKQLLQEKLVSLKMANTETSKPKKIYAITASGRKVLQAWLMKYPEPSQKRNELLLKVFFGWNAVPTVTINHLKQFHQKTELTLNKYRSSTLAKKAASSKLTSAELYRFLTLKAGIAYCETGLKWCEDVLHLLTTFNNKKGD